MVWFEGEDYHKLNPAELKLRWDKTNLTMDESASVRVSLWGYREDSRTPSMEFIELIDTVQNDGELIIYNPASRFKDRDNGYKTKYLFGFIQLNLTTPDTEIGESP